MFDLQNRIKGGPGRPDCRALRRGRGGGTGRWDAGGLLLAGSTIRGPRRDRTGAGRRALGGGRSRPGVLAGGGRGGGGGRPPSGAPGGGGGAGGGGGGSGGGRRGETGGGIPPPP